MRKTKPQPLVHFLLQKNTGDDERRLVTEYADCTDDKKKEVIQKIENKIFVM